MIILPFQTCERRLKQALKPFLTVKMEEKIKKEQASNIAGTNKNVFRAVRFTCGTLLGKPLEGYVVSAFPHLYYSSGDQGRAECRRSGVQEKGKLRGRCPLSCPPNFIEIVILFEYS